MMDPPTGRNRLPIVFSLSGPFTVKFVTLWRGAVPIRNKTDFFEPHEYLTAGIRVEKWLLPDGGTTYSIKHTALLFAFYFFYFLGSFNHKALKSSHRLSSSS